MIYLDNAATTGKKPQSVIYAVNSALKTLCANPGRSGHSVAERVGEMVYNTRKKVAKMFGATPHNVVFTQNCTESLNFVIKGVLEKGDSVIISSLEHNAVARPVFKLLSEQQIECDIAEVIMGDSEATFRSFERLVRENTKLIICTHASNVTGEILPIAKIGELCKEKNILFAVDAAQSAGVLPINMKKMNIDFLCVAAHKGLYAPMGTGLLICEKPLPKTLIEGGTGTYSNMLSQPEDMPERLESGTLNIPGIAGVSAGIDFINMTGIEKIYKHEIMLCKKLWAELSSIDGIILYTQEPKENKTAPVISFSLEGSTSMQIASYLSEKGIAVRAGLHCAPLAHFTLGTQDSGTVRVSPSVFNTENDVKGLVSAIKSYKNLQKKY